MRLISRTLDVPTSPIADAHRHVADRNPDVPLLDLSQAAPSYPTAPAVATRVAEVAASDGGGRYAPPPGLPDLLDAFADDLALSYGASFDHDQILPTGGCNQAFCVVASTLSRPGDEVIVPVPYYFNHDMWLKLDGVVPRYLHPTDPMVSLVPDPDRAADLINERTRAILLVTPGNPTGVTIPPEVIAGFHDLAAANDLALIIDETYRNFRTTDDPPHRLFDRPDWTDTVVSLHSFSKDLAIPGYRVGAIVAGAEVKVEALKLLDCVQICAPRVGQEAAAAGLRLAREWRADKAAGINRALDHFQAVMADKPGGFRLASAGAFFGWVRHPFDDRPTEQVVRDLVVEHGVLGIPGTAFTPTDEGWIRFSYANLSTAELDEFARRLAIAGE
ncbi:MAG: aminotransferase [Acidimicrobiia bacterium]|nr:aminotransferase [Acidimicrobiia bacterium]